MRALIICAIFSVLFLSGCASANKAEAQSGEKPNEPVSSSNDQEVTSVSDKQFSEEDIIRFIQEPVSASPLVDLSSFRDEKVIEIRSREELSQIQREFLEIAREKADPETGELKGVFAPIRAVTVVHTVNDIKTVQENFSSIGSFVSTFEVRFASDYQSVSDKPFNVTTLNLAKVSRSRIIISGVGDEPVNVGALSISLNDGIVQIYNLKWDNTTSQYSKISVTAERLFEAKKLIVTNTTTYRPTPSVDGMGTMFGGMGMMNGTGVANIERSPLIRLNSHAEGDIRPVYSIESVYAANNDMQSVLAFESNAFEKFDRASIRHVILKDNNMDYGFDITVSKDVLIDDIKFSDNSCPAFVQRSSKAHVVVSNSEGSSGFYESLADGEPTVEYK